MKKMFWVTILAAVGGCGGGGGGGTPPPAVVESYGMANLQAFDVLTDPDALLLASQAGATGLRATPNIGWHGVEPVVGGPYLWANADGAQQAVQSYGFDSFRVLSSPRPEYNSYPPEYQDNSYRLPHFAPDTGMDLWEQYKTWVRAVVRRYFKRAEDGNSDAMAGLTRPVKNWSYTPEVETFWVPILDPVQRAGDYAAMFQLTFDAIHEVDPEAKLFLPFNATTYLAAFVDGFLPRATIDFKTQTGLTPEQVADQYGDQILFVKTLIRKVHPDVYDFHLYGDAESIPGQKAWLLWYLGTQGLPEKPVYSMEGGEPYGGLGENFPQGPWVEDPARLAFQSSAMVRHFALAFANGYRCVTFTLSSEYADFGAWFGDLDLLNVHSTPRPAYYTYQLACRKLVPFVSASEVSGPPAGVRLFRFTFAAPKPDVWVAWGNATGPRDLSALLGFASAKVTQPVIVQGQTVPVETSESTGALPLGAVPAFLEAQP